MAFTVVSLSAHSESSSHVKGQQEGPCDSAGGDRNVHTTSTHANGAAEVLDVTLATRSHFEESLFYPTTAYDDLTRKFLKNETPHCYGVGHELKRPDTH